MGTAMNIESEKLLRLMTWLSPSFPVGGYSFSHALETAIELDIATDVQGLTDWLRADLTEGSGRVDAIFLCQAWQAIADGDMAAFVDVASLAAAMRGTAEFNLESQTQGAAFVSTVRAVWPNEMMDKALAALAAEGINPVLPVAVGLACAVNNIPLAPSVATYLHAWVANLVSAAVRAVPLGQTDGQRAIAVLEADVVQVADEATRSDLDDIGSASVMVDILSMQHETQYTRIFRS